MSACFHPEYYDARSAGPLHHPLVTNAVHALFPDDPDLVDYVIRESRNSQHRRADREPAKVASGMKCGSRLELLCIALAVDIHSDFAEPGHGLILVLPHHVSDLLVVPQAHKPGMPQVAKVDQFELDALKMVDAFISRTGFNVPSERIPQLGDGYGQEQIDTLDLTAAGIMVVIRATGYSFDFSLVKLPVTGWRRLSNSKARRDGIRRPLLPGHALAAQSQIRDPVRCWK